jgi:hypothetical protein
MIVRSTIDSDCQGKLYYIAKHMGKDTKVHLPKYRSRLSEYDSEQLIKELKKDPNIKTIYLYKINYSDGKISLIANPDKPIGSFHCEENK